MRRLKQKSSRDPVISLINIVFLILIFFMVAGSLATPPDRSIRFVQTADLDCCVPPDAISVDSTGRLVAGGQVVADAAEILRRRGDDPSPVRILPDRELPATKLLELIAALRKAGATDVIIVTEDTSA